MNTASLSKTIEKHFITFEEKLRFYFPSTAINYCDLVRNPCSSVGELHNNLTLQVQEKLIELRQDLELRL